MINYIKTFFSNMFGKNTSVYQKPLNALSVIFVIAFDIFLFYNILSGYNYQKDLVVSPYEKYSCVNYFQQDSLSLLSSIEYYYPNDEFLKIDLDGNTKTINYDGEICKTLEGKILKIKDSQEFLTYKSELNTLQNETSSLESQKYQYEYEYKDFLEESKAGITDYNSRLSDINKENARKNYNDIKSKIATNYQKQKDLETNFIQNNSDFQNLNGYIQENKESFLKNYDKEIFWYPVKITFFQAILLLPLFLISLLLYKVFLKRQNKIFTILFSNLTFITGLFVFVLFLKVIYFIIPKKLLAGFIALLKKLSLGFLWNYILVIIGVGVFGGIIYLSQKGFEKLDAIKKEQERLRIEQNKKKVQTERFEKGFCIECGKKLLPESRYCQTCGTDQFDECLNCKNLVPKVFDFCNKCGTKK